jgi:lysine-N-methylase
MKLYAPVYYQTFKCIADRCEHSCCVGWEIDVDARTLEKYRSLSEGYGKTVAESIELLDTPHFRLGAGDRCPHLDARGLCKIILSLGEDHLRAICREHPRFYNFTDVAEVGVGLSCPEAARVVLSASDFDLFTEVGEVDAAPDGVAFDGRAERGAIYALLSDPLLPYPAALDRIYRSYGVEAGEDAQWLNVLASLEYLDADHKALFLQYGAENPSTGGEVDEYRRRFLAYLIYRHCTEALDPDDFCARLSFSLFCERLLASLISAEGARSLREVAALASIISEEIEYSDENVAALTW